MPNTEGERCCISQSPILYLNVPLSLAIYPANAYPSNVFIKGPYGKHMGNHLWLTCHLLMMLYEVFLFLVCLGFFVLFWFFFLPSLEIQLPSPEQADTAVWLLRK